VPIKLLADKNFPSFSPPSMPHPRLFDTPLAFVLPAAFSSPGSSSIISLTDWFFYTIILYFPVDLFAPNAFFPHFCTHSSSSLRHFKKKPLWTSCFPPSHPQTCLFISLNTLVFLRPLSWICRGGWGSSNAFIPALFTHLLSLAFLVNLQAFPFFVYVCFLFHMSLPRSPGCTPLHPSNGSLM